LNYGKWVGASSTNIQMQKAGEIHNNENELCCTNKKQGKKMEKK
jgi:hypothetical protein